MVRKQPPAPGSDLGVEGTDTHIITTLLSGNLTVRPARATGHLEGGGEAARPRAPGKRVKASNSRQTEWKATTAAHSWRLLCSCSPGSYQRRHLSSPPPKSIPSPLTQHLHSRRLPPRSTQAQEEASIKALSERPHGAFPLQACISRRTKSFSGAHPTAPHLCQPCSRGMTEAPRAFRSRAPAECQGPYRALTFILPGSQSQLVAITSILQRRNQIIALVARLGLTGSRAHNSSIVTGSKLPSFLLQTQGR